LALYAVVAATTSLSAPQAQNAMPTFQSNPFRSSKGPESFGDRIAATYRRSLARHPFALFGLPFIAMMLGASFLLTPATALRYEHHDRKNRELSHGEAMELGLKGGSAEDSGMHYNPRRRQIGQGGTTQRDEYYVSEFGNSIV
jgi:hypothetical protein